jgi:hypothetical protein
VTVFAAIAGVVPSSDVADICQELFHKHVHDGEGEVKLVVSAEVELNKSDFECLPSDRFSIFRCSVSDADHLYAAIAYAMAPVVPVKMLINEVGYPLPSPRPSIDSLSLSRIESLLDSGRARLAGAMAASTRKGLQTSGSLLNASLAEALRQFSLVSELVEELRTPTFKESGGVLARRGYDTDLLQLVTACNTAIQAFEKACPEVASFISHTKEFFRTGRSLADVAFRRSNPRYEFLVWLASYFLRLANLRLGIGDVSEALQLSVRGLETYSLYHTTAQGVVELDGGAFRWARDGKKVSGVGELFSELQNKLPTRFLLANQGHIDQCREAIDLRNRSTFGHGVQRLQSSEASRYVSTIRRLIQAIEQDEVSGGERWARLNNGECLSVRGVLKPLIKRALENSLVLGRI